MKKYLSNWNYFLFISISILMAGVFFGAQIRQAAGKPFWLDEVFSHTASLGKSVSQYLVKGAPGQGSPAPLDYLLLQLLKGIQDGPNYFGLHPHSYYRLVANLSVTILGLLSCWYVAFRSGKLSLEFYIPLFALLFFYTGEYNFYYAAEMRPYALWNSLWFLALCMFFFEPKYRIYRIVVLSLLAFTATASIFQLLCLIVSYVGIRFFLSRKDGVLIAKEAVKTFVFPLFVAAYYSFRSGQWGYVGPESGVWSDFFEFWLSHVLILGYSLGAVLICFLSRKTILFSVPALAQVLLFLVGPIIFYVTRQKGFFFSHRQYIYYDLALPIFILTLFCCSFYWVFKARRLHVLKTCVILLVFLVIYESSARTKIRAVKQFYRDAPLLKIPDDSAGELTHLLETERPKGYCFEVGVSANARHNMRLVTAWIFKKFDNKNIGDKTVFLAAIENENCRVVEVNNSECPSEQFVPSNYR